MLNDTLLNGSMYGWLTNLQAILSNQARVVCSLWIQCGTTAMTTGAWRDIYLVCWLTTLKSTVWGIFPHSHMSSEYSVSPMHVWVSGEMPWNAIGQVTGWWMQSQFLETCLDTKCTCFWKKTCSLLSLFWYFVMLRQWWAVKVQTPVLPQKHGEDFQGLWQENPALFCLFGLVPLPVIAYLWNLPKLFNILIYTVAVAVCSYKGQCVQM